MKKGWELNYAKWPIFPMQQLNKKFALCYGGQKVLTHSKATRKLIRRLN